MENKYIDKNSEAKLYEHNVTYEECIKCLKKSDNLVSNIWVEQLNAAINKSKVIYPQNENKENTDFFNKYYASLRNI